MSSVSYTLILENNFKEAQKFAVFLAPPLVNNKVSENVFTNVWIAKTLEPGAYYKIKYSLDFAAYAGNLEESLAPGVTVQSGSFQPVVLGSSKGKGTSYTMNMASGSSTVFLDAKTKAATAPDNTFIISTCKGFSDKANAVIGLAQKDNTGHNKPTATIAVNPNTTYTIKPIIKFYVKVGSYTSGTVIDYTSEVNDCPEIDFSSDDNTANSHTARTTLSSKNELSAVYEDDEE